MFRIAEDQLPMEVPVLKSLKPEPPKKKQVRTPRVERPFHEVPKVLYEVLPNITTDICKTTVGKNARIGYNTVRYVCWILKTLDIFYSMPDGNKPPQTIRTLH